jgi:hypothetical protein
VYAYCSKNDIIVIERWETLKYYWEANMMKTLEIELELVKLLHDYMGDVVLAEDIAEDIMILLKEKIN